MPTYVPDPTDPTQPTDGQPAGTAAAEFRALKAYLASGGGPKAASQVTFTPASGVPSTDVQAAIEFLGVNGAATAAALANLFASSVKFVPTGSITNVNVQAALAEVSLDADSAVAWIAAVTAASIPFVPTGSIVATNVQAAIAEVSGDADLALTRSSTAANIPFVPTGTIAATNVQAAIAEVATDAAADNALMIPLAQKGVASGVATLDSGIRVPMIELPAGMPSGLATLGPDGLVSPSQLPPTAGPFVPLGQKGAANGVASLDPLALIPIAQIPSLSGLYVALGQKAAANGVATLDAGTKIPVAQLPDLSGTYVNISQKAAANGVATLDGTTHIPVAQIPNLSGTYLTPGAAASTYIPLSQKDAANGVPGLNASGFITGSQLPIGVAQCKLILNSTTTLYLQPFNGHYLTISGVPRDLNIAGAITIGAASFPSLLTNYAVYAYWTGSQVLLEASGTAAVFDPTTGMYVKSGDVNRTLVGYAARYTDGLFYDQQDIRLVRSWFNDNGFTFGAYVTGSPPLFTNGVWNELSTTARSYVLTIGGGFDFVSGSGGIVGVPDGSGYMYAAIGYDGNVQTIYGLITMGPAGVYAQCNCNCALFAPTGVHMWSMYSGAGAANFTPVAGGYCGYQCVVTRR